ncbi:MAG: T9SS type A sorting domain-containing protein [Schleiferiaceae bacterium]|jgi:hypothetical protein|tara:strand:- start:3365 stop:4636 length:1272 start_codon:yes stop_codon:yes gene_type:complete
MKKVLLLAAVALGLSTMGQDAMNSRLLQTEITPTSAAKEKVEDILINRGGALDANYDYTDFLYQFYSSDMVLGAITTTPDSSTVIVYSDGTPGYSYNHAVGAVYDFNYYGWGDNEFNETDQVTIDSLFVIGGYDIYNSSDTDKIRFTIFKGANSFAAPFSGVQYNAGTFAALDVAATPTAKTMDYAGSASDGNQGGPTASNTLTIDYTLSAADTSVAVVGVEVPNGGLTMNGNELLGIFIEYLPGGNTTSDTINYQTASGDINPFAFYYYREGNTSAPQGYFIQDYDSTSTNCSNFLFNTTRYAAHAGTSAWRNDQTSINMNYSHLIWVAASGTSTMTIQDADLSTVSVFPNPSNGVVNVELNATTSAAVTVVDVLGQVIYSANTNFVAGQRQMIDLSNNAKGMYILSIEGEGVNTVERITIK